MTLTIIADPLAAVRAAAVHAAASLRRLLAEQPSVRLVAATGSTQIRFLEYLVKEPDIDWARVELFHLDEYVGISPSHPASFVNFLETRLVRPTGIRRAHWLDGTVNPAEVIERVGQALASAPVDLLFAGIGENGHIAFNEPPADFTRSDPYFEVELDVVSRQQQVGEGWFDRLEDVPKTAVTMSVRQVMKARELVVIVLGRRKARAVSRSFGGPVVPDAPASILQGHPGATIYADREAAAELPEAI